MSAFVRSWLVRNSAPIVMVLLAAALVIVAVEGLDALAGSGSAPAETASVADGAEGVASIAALAKPLLFLAVGAGATVGVRRLARRLRAIRRRPTQD